MPQPRLNELQRIVERMRVYNSTAQRLEEINPQAYQAFMTNEEQDGEFMEESWNKIAADQWDFDRSRFVRGLKKNADLMRRRISSLQTPRSLTFEGEGMWRLHVPRAKKVTVGGSLQNWTVQRIYDILVRRVEEKEMTPNRRLAIISLLNQHKQHSNPETAKRNMEAVALAHNIHLTPGA